MRKLFEQGRPERIEVILPDGTFLGDGVINEEGQLVLDPRISRETPFPNTAAQIQNNKEN